MFNEWQNGMPVQFNGGTVRSVSRGKLDSRIGRPLDAPVLNGAVSRWVAFAVASPVCSLVHRGFSGVLFV